MGGWVVMGIPQPPTHTHTARDRMSRFNPAIYFVPQCSFMFNVLSFRIWLEAAFVFLISCCFRLFLLWIVCLLLSPCCAKESWFCWYLIIAFWGFCQDGWQLSWKNKLIRYKIRFLINIIRNSVRKYLWLSANFQFRLIYGTVCISIYTYELVQTLAITNSRNWLMIANVH